MKKVFVFIFVAVLIGKIFCLETSTNVPADFPKIKPTGFAKARYTVDTTAGKKDGFTIAQACFGVKGDISKDVVFSFSLEGTNTDTNNNKVLYDAYIDIKSVPYFAIRLGQFKYRFSLEQCTSDIDLELVNKSEVVSNLVSPTRDIGVELCRQFSFSAVKGNISAAVMNGSGSNQSDENDNKTSIARLVLSPIKGFDVGGSIYNGLTSTSSIKKDRTGFEAKYEVEKLLCKAEYVFGKDDDVKKRRILCHNRLHHAFFLRFACPL